MPGWVHELKRRIEDSAPPTPGLISQEEARRRAEHRPRQRSAILILLNGQEHRDASVLLTHRSPRMRTHPGQVAFPGGRMDPEDRDEIDTALREAWEETGVHRHGITPFAQLPDAHTHVGAAVSPIMAWWHAPSPVWAASPAETDEVFHAGFADLVDPSNRVMVGRRMPSTGDPWIGPAFWSHGYLVWGFTGALLAGLIASGGWEEEWDRDTIYDLNELLAVSRNNEESQPQTRGGETQA
ncbi:NUDIX domain-containing protein [Corynebacterium poyangense]|uniref:NUDIX domain-containing protein n=2 Tax=Corynebacterium poyangense TaxID=2684405 RepID=A0A7H0SS31_9CORY|nr:NUDIX domain-containing protein [Corynebacterium poyangense]QNQ91356.1 NUDIX domain-containing protein [Corynebacterium poyangense]